MKKVDCETCPLSWEDRGYEGECYDCGCDVYGDLYGYKLICHFPDFIKRMMRRYVDKKIDKEMEHAYDGIGEWYEEERKKDAAFRQVVEECILKNRYGEELILCREDVVGNRYKVEISEEFSLARMRYEEILENGSNQENDLQKEKSIQK